MKNPKKGPFDLSVDLEKIPSYRTRFQSMDAMAGGLKLKQEPVSTEAARDQHKNLREKLGTMTDRHTLPSVILRRKGIRV